MARKNDKVGLLHFEKADLNLAIVHNVNYI